MHSCTNLLLEHFYFTSHFSAFSFSFFVHFLGLLVLLLICEQELRVNNEMRQ